ncbi:MAG: hypothetical protein ACOYM9_19065 [Bradymonadia bacterium]|jgi:hypothetical protein
MKRSPRILGFVTAALLGFSVPSTAVATIVRPLTVEDMTRRADLVCVGTITGQRSEWNAERTRIYTWTEVRIARSLKGKRTAGETVTVRQLGGVVDGISQSIPGNAKLVPGEEVVLFLDADEAAPLHYVIGMAQGKFTISRAPGEVAVRRDVGDLAFAGAAPLAAPGAPAVPAQLEALEQAVRRASTP